MRVFISWSGQRSGALAAILKDKLPLILHYVEPWLSQADIYAGDRWGLEVAKELDVPAFGITCVTSENLVAPWLLFEAGALAKSISDGRVVPLLLDIDFSEISGPLAQFQAKKVDKSGFLEIVTAINRASDLPVQDARLAQLFELIWPDIDQKVALIAKSATPQKRPRPQAEVLDELVQTVRSLELRQQREDVVARPRDSEKSRRYARLKLIEQTIDWARSSKDDLMPLLILGAVLRDDYPWLYEQVADINRRLARRGGEELHALWSRLLRSLDILIDLRIPRDDYENRVLDIFAREVRRYYTEFENSRRVVVSST